MIKTLVTSDFSANSKAAIHFALQFSRQYSSVHLTFFHSHHVVKPTSLDDNSFDIFRKHELKDAREKLQDLVNEIKSEMGIHNLNADFVVKESIVPSSNIITYAEKENFNFICIGTRGAGVLEKILGTNTANVINKSTVPVIAVPVNYTVKPINHLLYATDLTNFEVELKKVINFSRPLNSKIDVIHFAFPSDIITKNKEAENTLKSITDYPVDFKIIENNFSNTLVDNIKKRVEKTNTSLLVMFTNQKRPFLEKLLFSGNTEDVALETTVPLLVFRK